jgi:hypothetical protein
MPILLFVLTFAVPGQFPMLCCASGIHKIALLA